MAATAQVRMRKVLARPWVGVRGLLFFFKLRLSVLQAAVCKIFPPKVILINL